MSWKLRLVIAALLVAFVALQYRLWAGKGSIPEVRHLQQQIAAQQAELAELNERNDSLRAEVEDLRKGLEAVEARARAELGMIREGETFYQVIPPQGAAARD
jgi:cell division protein FtsB